MNTDTNTTPDTQTEKNRKFARIVAIALAVIVVIVLIVSGIRGSKKVDTIVSDALPEGCKPGYLFSETSGKPCPQTETVDSVKTDTEGVLNTSGYEAAIKAYAGKVVIFGTACKPVSMISGSIAPGTRILVANNSNTSLALAVGGKSEVLDGYHYFTTTLKTTGDTAITCDAKTAATITVK